MEDSWVDLLSDNNRVTLHILLGLVQKGNRKTQARLTSSGSEVCPRFMKKEH